MIRLGIFARRRVSQKDVLLCVYEGAFPFKAFDPIMATIPFCSAFRVSYLVIFFFPIFLENALNMALKLGLLWHLLFGKCSIFSS